MEAPPAAGQQAGADAGGVSEISVLSVLRRVPDSPDWHCVCQQPNHWFCSNQYTGSYAHKAGVPGDPAKLWIVKSNGGGAQRPSALSVMGMSGCGVLLSVTASFEDGGQYIMYSEDVSNPSDFLLSAEL